MGWLPEYGGIDGDFALVALLGFDQALRRLGELEFGTEILAIKLWR